MTLQLSADAVAPKAAAPQKYLFGPVADFLMLGGSAFLILPVLFLVPLEYEGPVAATMVVVAYLVNYPHFAHSYQLFYRNFGRKVTGDGYDRSLQLRYIFAGIVVPLVMAGFFAYGAVAANTRLLGFATNAMFFFVGWHYVKQGYGMLMVDAVLKRKFFDDRDKKVLLVNSYAVWILSWLQTNTAVTQGKYYGLDYYTFAVPSWITDIALLAAIASTAATLLMLVNRWRKNGGKLPYNGIVAYVASLYLWILIVRINPLWLLIVPALHSLQYLAVVWRYQTNVERDSSDAERDPQPKILSFLGPLYRFRLLGFIVGGTALGYLGFWLIPSALTALIPYDRQVLGSSLFFFIVLIFINVHHYFLDNVMWRRGNPEVSKYLFR
ncbi:MULTISPECIES: hypothetical protein [unclassified Mesorhizobium]|uniref:hypothetical protein n=1 Tax=unclassified Mesorhizobium TaxID=325217 RepID=UPI0003CF5CAE|nr:MULTISPECIES: hypothetical protein [unclassified Mesorhizobium]ESX15823.1 hypothetical protein X766_23835 [Mesorhizobium sp. LSJC255A00]ESX31387.1 hypothetical protein X765_00435 [Mesorhizobium sp. LSHC440B00]ESX38065.1 hypothetical protein X764_23025 [Mesorhizobium sp. LSHC440A00]ESX39893.1 hypothetical protein X763_07975 [Mesorhizobium sp. LSHC432A00]ESY40242.1 hypothetical protein X747_19435 [Mesorhizobium sp. LNJC384A00]